MQQLEASYHVIALDLCGEGGSTASADSLQFSINDEVTIIQPLLNDLKSYHLVGHSYGGSVALQLALSYPEKVSSIIVYEPALWGMLTTYWPDDSGAKDLLVLREKTLGLIESGDIENATKTFVDYWAGDGAWNAQQDIQPLLMKGMRSVASKWKADIGLNVSPVVLNALADKIPMLILMGSDSAPAASDLMQRLQKELNHASFIELAQLGHMGPVTHPKIVNAEIEAFLKRNT